MSEQRTIAHLRRASGRPTAGELAERVSYCRRRLEEGGTDGAVKRSAADRFGVSPRSVERYLRRAREGMVADRGGTAEEMRDRAGAFFLHIAHTGDGDAVKLRAMGSFVRLHGLNAPAATDPLGGCLTEEALEREERRRGLLG